MKETKGEEGVVLVVEIMNEERRVGEIDRRVLGTKGVLPMGLCSSGPANFFDNVCEVTIFRIHLFGICGEVSELGTSTSTAVSVAKEGYQRI